MPKTHQREIDRTPHEYCRACKSTVWSLALHLFSCPAAFPEMTEAEREQWTQIERRMQDVADKMLERNNGK